MNYQMRPVTIPFIDAKGIRREYQPLCLLNYWRDSTTPKSQKNLLADVWCNEDIRANADWLIPAWRAAHRFAQYKRLEFRMFRDTFFLSDYFHNVKFTSRYTFLDVPKKDWILIETTIEEKQIVNFSELLDLAATNKEHRGNLIRYIWTLVSKGVVDADWNKRFNADTELWISW